MRHALALAALASLTAAGSGRGAERLIKPPISASPPVANSALGWWAVVATGPSASANVPESARADFGRSVRAAAAACGYDLFEEDSGFFTGFPEDGTFQVYAVGGYRTKAEAQRVLDRIKPCMPTAYLKSMSLQSE